MLIDDIEHFLRRTRMATTRFGREAVGDPNFVSNLRDGREPRRATVRRVRAYLAKAESAGPGAP
jgi:2,4-dienoyl-CoA reductase-like NADH-dependent reductase (Old Yellow Enzyme family)